jgi:tetraacyldisaccharide 4'-kinase
MEIVDLRRMKPPDEAGVVGGALRPLLLPAASLYEAGTWLRRRMPGRGTDPGVPVVSIGSLSVGGTGKTPLCMLVARHYWTAGRRTCILSRGYKRRSRQSPVVVSDGRELLATVEAAGDEPYMMASRLEGTAVIVGKDRAAAAETAVAALGADLLLLDDGFQTRSIRKSIEVVCMDRRSLSSKASHLPLGILREGRSAIAWADLVVVMLTSGEPEPDAAELAWLGEREVFFATRTLGSLMGSDGGPMDWEEARNRRSLLVSGIARPDNFERVCLEEGLNAVASVRFDDHHWYGKADHRRLRDLMAEFSCDMMVTTDKDVHKLDADLRGGVAVLGMDLVLKKEHRFWSRLDAGIGCGE